MISGEQLLAAAVGFASELRGAGVPVGMSQTLDFIRALDQLDLGVRGDVRAASRAIHVSRREDIPIHDELFDIYWSAVPRTEGLRTARDAAHRGRNSDSSTAQSRSAAIAGAGTASGSRQGDASTPALTVARRTYSRDEVLRTREFDRMTPAELIEAERLIDRLAVNLLGSADAPV